MTSEKESCPLHQFVTDILRLFLALKPSYVAGKGIEVVLRYTILCAIDVYTTKCAAKKIQTIDRKHTTTRP
jgi:hypothetical protein